MSPTYPPKLKHSQRSESAAVTGDSAKRKPGLRLRLTAIKLMTLTLSYVPRTNPESSKHR